MVSGDWLALGAVAALVAVGSARRGSENRSARKGSRAKLDWALTPEGVESTRRLFTRFADTESFELEDVQWVDPEDLHEDDLDYPRDREWVVRYEAMLRAGHPISPILVSENMVWDGHHRWTAAKNLGLDRIPVMNMEYR